MLFGLLGMCVCGTGVSEPPGRPPDTGGFTDPDRPDTGTWVDDCAPWIVVEPEAVDFGEVIGEAEPLTVTITNGGDCELALFEVLITEVGDREAFALGEVDPQPVPPGGSLSVEVRFVGDEPRAYLGELAILSNDPYDRELTLALRAERVEALGRMALEPTLLDLGEVPIGCSAEDTVLVRNVGNAPLVVEGMELLSAAEELSVEGDLPVTLEPEEVYALRVTLTPHSTYDALAYLRVMGDGEPAEAVAELRGRGLEGSVLTSWMVADGETRALPLEHVPVAFTLVVVIDGVTQLEGWSYDADANAVVFDVAPAGGVDVVAQYTVQPDCG